MSPDPSVALARALIARPSITPEDAGCQPLMIERLEALGFRCQRLRFGDTDNFWAEWGDGGPLFAFAGHTDVVPPGPGSAWDSDPFVPIERDGHLYGRGAADMKSSLAAMIIACETVLAGHRPAGRIGFLVTSDEEGPATHGTVKVMEWLQQQGTRLDYCIVGEPSSAERLGDTIKNGRRGSLNGRLMVKGRQGHVAYPQHADNPIHRALPALQALSTRHWDAGDRFFPPSCLQITHLSAGAGASNVIPGALEVRLNFRFSTAQTAAGLKAQVEACLAEHGVNADIEWKLSGQPFVTAAGALVEASRAAIRDLLGIEAALSTGGGTSDARFIAPYGAQVLELGPVNASIHRANENVRVADLPRLAGLYAEIVRRVLPAA